MSTTVALRAACRLEHREGLADAGSEAEEDLELCAASALFGRFETLQQGVRVGPRGELSLRIGAIRCRHEEMIAACPKRDPSLLATRAMRPALGTTFIAAPPRSGQPHRRQNHVDQLDAGKRREDATHAVDQHVPAQDGLRADRSVGDAFSARGISTMMITALKMTADRMADSGVASRMTFSGAAAGTPG
jgi:hypothetical protein